MHNDDLHPLMAEAAAPDDEGPAVGLLDLLTWVGEGKRVIAAVTVAAAVVSLGVALLLTPVYTARTTLLPPGSQQQSSSAAALAALGSLGGLAGGLGAKTPDELYVALLKSDSVQRALDQRFDLKKRYEVQTHETLRRVLPGYIRVSSDKKTGVISVEVDDEDPKFAAELANAHLGEVTRVLGRLAVSEAQLRRVFFEQQLKETKENLIQAEREVQLKVLRTGATEQNPDVLRLVSELRALRGELARMESSQGGNPGSAVDMGVGKIPEAAVDFVRARRELKLQETLLESMLRQYEIAKLDEAKEGPVLQQVDVALPPDYKSKPSRALIVLASTLIALLASVAWVVSRRYLALARDGDPGAAAAWQALRRAWSPRGRS